MKDRTLEKLSRRNEKVYVYLADREIGNRFLRDAEKEGFTFGDGKKPTSRSYAEIMAVNSDRTINYLGSIGRIAFGSGAKKVGGRYLLRVDYKKYVNG